MCEDFTKYVFLDINVISLVKIGVETGLIKLAHRISATKLSQSLDSGPKRPAREVREERLWNVFRHG